METVILLKYSQSPHLKKLKQSSSIWAVLRNTALERCSTLQTKKYGLGDVLNYANFSLRNMALEMCSTLQTLPLRNMALEMCSTLQTLSTHFTPRLTLRLVQPCSSKEPARLKTRSRLTLQELSTLPFVCTILNMTSQIRSDKGIQSENV